mgnify:CR=1 FL=1
MSKNWATPAHCRCVFLDLVNSEEVGGECSAPLVLHAESSVKPAQWLGREGRSTSGTSRHHSIVQRALTQPSGVHREPMEVPRGCSRVSGVSHHAQGQVQVQRVQHRNKRLSLCGEQYVWTGHNKQRQQCS